MFCPHTFLSFLIIGVGKGVGKSVGSFVFGDFRPIFDCMKKKGGKALKRIMTLVSMMTALLFSLTGCGGTLLHPGTVSVIYAVITLLSVTLTACYFFVVRKKDLWFSLLFTLIPLINLGYFLISVSGSLSQALWANRLAYLASVFLPFTMLMIICRVTGTSLKKPVVLILVVVSAAVFLLTASQGVLPVYYKEVTLVTDGGFSYLSKVYGPLHVVYLFYLLFYFASVAATTIYAIVKKKMRSRMHAVLLAFAVFVNIGVWSLGQFADFEFEFLSVSYVTSQMFLLGLQLLVKEHERLLAEQEKKRLSEPSARAKSREDAVSDAVCEEEERSRELALADFEKGLPELTKTEKTIYLLYLERKSTKEIMMQLEITENTLKYHNKNLYSKLGVSSRKQLLAYASLLEKRQSSDQVI